MTLSKKKLTLPSFDINDLKSICPPWINKVDLFDVIESTNTYLIKIVPHSPTLVVAHHQSGGRGTHQRPFYCAPNEGLYVSFSWSEKLDFPISLIIGASIIQALLDHGFQPKIKWVNDILINNKKVGGILCETFIHGVVVGFGINVNVSSFPQELEKRAGSLHEFTDDVIHPLKLCSTILHHFSILMKHPHFVHQIINEHLIYVQEKVLIQHCGKKYTGTVLGINEKGFLLLNTSDGQLTFSTTLQSIKHIDD